MIGLGERERRVEGDQWLEDASEIVFEYSSRCQLGVVSA